MTKKKNQKKITAHFLFYLSCIFIVPIIWYLIENKWYKNMNQQISDKMFYIWQKNQKLPVIWQKIDGFLQLNFAIQFSASLSQNLLMYQKGVESVWDNLKNQKVQLNADQLKNLIKFTDFVKEIKQIMIEYNSDVLLFNNDLKKWPRSVVGDNLKLKPIKFIPVS